MTIQVCIDKGGSGQSMEEEIEEEDFLPNEQRKVDLDQKEG
jgi:hypothetical protein